MTIEKMELRDALNCCDFIRGCISNSDLDHDLDVQSALAHVEGYLIKQEIKLNRKES